MDVGVDVGPSFSSQRAAIVRSVTNMMAITQDPETQKVLQAIALMNMEGEGLRDARDFFRRQLLEMGVVKPTPQEAEELAAAAESAEEDPNAVFLKAAAEEANAKATRARAEVVKTMADTELTKARSMQILADIEHADREQLISVVKMLVDEREKASIQREALPDFTGQGASPEFAARVSGLAGDVQGEFVERLSNLR